MKVNKMEKQRVLLDGLDFIDLGVTNRKSVIKTLGNPEDFSFEDEQHAFLLCF